MASAFSHLMSNLGYMQPQERSVLAHYGVPPRATALAQKLNVPVAALITGAAPAHPSLPPMASTLQPQMAMSPLSFPTGARKGPPGKPAPASAAAPAPPMPQRQPPPPPQPADAPADTSAGVPSSGDLQQAAQGAVSYLQSDASFFKSNLPWKWIGAAVAAAWLLRR